MYIIKRVNITYIEKILSYILILRVLLKQDWNKLKKQNLLMSRKIKSIKSYIKGEELTGLYYFVKSTMILVIFI